MKGQNTKWSQLSLDSARKPSGRGGWRPGAGRPKGRKSTPHLKRPETAARIPQHVTWRTGPDAPNLRSYYPHRYISDAIRATNCAVFRVIEFSIQGNHLHMLIEAASKRALSSGMRALARRITPKLKKKFSWRGRLFTRYHSRPLSTPREVRNALRYVLLNSRHHAAQRGATLDKYWIDPYSSAYWFDGWKRSMIGNQDLRERNARVPKPTAAPETWLLAHGWRRWGLLNFDEVPGH